MAKVILSKKSSGLNITQQKIYIFHEIINSSDQMANFINNLLPSRIANKDVKAAMKLVEEWSAFKNIFIVKITSILECVYSLEKASKEYSKLIPSVGDLGAKVIMASMLDRMKQDVNRLKNFLINA
jgi:hypothetical protein